jgi:hypothetical protein
MSSESSSGAASGAAQGAAAGAAFGPWGAIIGGVIGGIAGALSGKKAKEAKKYAALARGVRREQQTMQLAVARRDVVRQQRMAVAQAIAAGTADAGVESSAIKGATSSSQTQGQSAINYFDTQVSKDNLFQIYAAKSGKAAQSSQEIMSFIGAAGGLAQAGGDLYGMSQTPKAETSPYTSFNRPVSQVKTYPYVESDVKVLD